MTRPVTGSTGEARMIPKTIKLQTADEIAGAAVFLASAAGNFMTGQSMVIDGGATIS